MGSPITPKPIKPIISSPYGPNYTRRRKALRLEFRTQRRQHRNDDQRESRPNNPAQLSTALPLRAVWLCGHHAEPPTVRFVTETFDRRPAGAAGVDEHPGETGEQGHQVRPLADGP